jgi:3-oxoacyl-(acyl-carrier-protein) synthase
MLGCRHLEWPFASGDPPPSATRCRIAVRTCVYDYVYVMYVSAVVSNSFGFGGHNASIAAKKFMG